MVTKIFLDSEFTSLRQDTTLISIGLISENGKSFYAEFNDYNQDLIDSDPWLIENVINNLLYNTEYFKSVADKVIYGNTIQVRIALKEWLRQFDQIEIWSDCLAYDWVLFNDLFGRYYGSLPKNVSYIPFDICTLMKIKGIDPDINREEFINNSVIGKKHNSLYDARVIKACYEKLIKGE